MGVVGKVESLWRYPVKSMAGEEREELFVGYAGVYGDRLFAVGNAGAPARFPYLTAREESGMLAYRPRFRHPEKAALPINLAEARGITPTVADPTDLAVDVETPSGDRLAIDDPALLRALARRVEGAALRLLCSERALTDCRPVSLFSLQTAEQLGAEIGAVLDKRRFRANIYMDLESGPGFAEDSFVGKSLKIGSQLVISVLERDGRCKMITLDPDTGEANPEILRKVARAHEGRAGVYAAVLMEGVVRRGDVIEIIE
ncbi:MAG TPA: MOSC domain-containing protein [Verrucomicrobiae bacterium]|nr:MOSC domain-containing protein [Verrucomicrobiae bacterium]